MTEQQQFNEKADQAFAVVTAFIWGAVVVMAFSVLVSQ